MILPAREPGQKTTGVDREDTKMARLREAGRQTGTLEQQDYFICAFIEMRGDGKTFSYHDAYEKQLKVRLTHVRSRFAVTESRRVREQSLRLRLLDCWVP